MKTGLLIIDIQNDYFANGKNPLSAPEPAADNTASVLQLFRQKGLKVIHVQHISTRPGSTFFLPYTVGAEIYPKLKPADGEKIIIKHSPNSFSGTDLEQYLKDNEIENLVICGMMTHLCVDTTVRAAADLGYKCLLVSDATATKDLTFQEQKVEAAQVQTAFLGAMNWVFAQIINTEELINNFDEYVKQ